MNRVKKSAGFLAAALMAAVLGLTVPGCGRSPKPESNAGEPGKELAVVRAAAEKGDGSAQVKLASSYESGTPQDLAQALLWYRRAADQGIVVAQSKAGCFLENGMGVATNLDEALAWYDKASRQGDTLAAARISAIKHAREAAARQAQAEADRVRAAERQSKASQIFLEGMKLMRGDRASRDFTNAVSLFSQAAEMGHADAQMSLGLLSVSGQGMPKDFEAAAKWFKLAAEQGKADAQFNLAILYVTGRGVAQDHAEAARWARLAADQGQPDAQYNLALMHVQGQGVSKDLPQAAQWFQKSAEQGHPGSQSNLGFFYMKGEGVKQDYAAAQQWFLKAAEQGNSTAQFNLGVMYKKGQGVEQDLEAAYMWSNIAASQGDEEAGRNRELLALDMTPRQIASAIKKSADKIKMIYDNAYRLATGDTNAAPLTGSIKGLLAAPATNAPAPR